MRFTFAVAAAGSTPDFARPISHSDCDLAAYGLSNQGCTSCSIDKGIQTSATSPTTVPKKSRGATPTMVNVVPLKENVLPIAPGSPANRRSQNAKLTTATGLPPGFKSSSAVIVWPAAGSTPSVEK